MRDLFLCLGLCFRHKNGFRTKHRQRSNVPGGIYLFSEFMFLPQTAVLKLNFDGEVKPRWDLCLFEFMFALRKPVLKLNRANGINPMSNLFLCLSLCCGKTFPN